MDEQRGAGKARNELKQPHTASSVRRGDSTPARPAHKSPAKRGAKGGEQD